MGGLHFIHFGFLAGTLAVAVPVAVHLLFRQKPRLVEIGSIRFLKVVLRDHVRRRKVRRWALLALRVAGVLLLALLFARPYWVGARELGGDREVVILIDRSASMAAGARGRSAFDRARDGAESVLKALPGRTAVRLAYYDDSGVSPAPVPAVDRTSKPGYSGTDHALALAWARDRVLLSTRADRRVYLFTDLQRSGVERSPFGGWPQGAALDLVDVGKPLAANLAVVEAAVDRTEVRGATPFTVSAVVVNTGPFPARDVSVKLSLAGVGRTIEQAQTVTIDGGARRVVRFPVKDVRPGLYQGAVEVAAGDEFPLDDRRWLAFEARALDRVLLVDGEPGSSVYTGETYYLETALRLRPPGPGATATPYDPVRVPWSAGKPLPDLRKFRVVALCNVGVLTDADVSALRNHVETGGGLVIFPGDQTSAAASGRLRAARLMPAEFVENTRDGSYRFATWDKGDPVFKPFSDPQRGDLRLVEFRRISRFKPDAGARVLAATGAGDPLAVAWTQGQGRGVLLAFAADRDRGDWPVHRLYVPLVHQVFGDLTGRLPEASRARSLPAGPGREHPPGVERSGNFLVSRNLDPGESETERVTPDEFRAAYHLPTGGPRSGASRADEPAAAVPGTQRPDELWRSVVWGLFLILVAETFVANRTAA